MVEMNNILETGEYSAMFLLMSNLNPSDPACIFTTMQFVSSQGTQYDVTLILTFYQPSYWFSVGSISH